MKKASQISVFLLTWTTLCMAANDARFWPHWRGPRANGIADPANPPLHWGEDRNIRWKVEIPGKGSSSPIIWGSQVFVTTALQEEQVGTEPEEEAAGGGRRGPRGVAPSKHSFIVMALDRASGKTVWKRTALVATPHEGTHPDGTWASNSAVTDGESLYAYFGSQGLFAYTLNGELRWKRDLGDMRVKLGFGEGSSPLLAGDKIILLWDHEDDSFIVALDKNTGEEVWKVSRDERTSWSSPLAVEWQGKTQIITSATARIRSYDLDDGSLIWESSGMTANAIPSPVAGDGMVYLTSGFRGNSLLAIRLDKAQGEITGSAAVAWSHDKDTPYVPSPLLYNGNLYILKSNSGVLSNFEARTGQLNYGPERLEGLQGVYASPVGAAGRVYIAGREGTTVVLDEGEGLNVLATNSLEDGFDASPALVDNELYLRGRHLYCIVEE